jgi:hypothetical protein
MDFCSLCAKRRDAKKRHNMESFWGVEVPETVLPPWRVSKAPYASVEGGVIDGESEDDEEEPEFPRGFPVRVRSTYPDAFVCGVWVQDMDSSPPRRRYRVGIPTPEFFPTRTPWFGGVEGGGQC